MTPIIAFLTVAFIVLPQWLLMLLRPHSKWTQKLVDSDIIPFILLVIYVVCITRNGADLQIQTISDIFQFFHTPTIVLAAWAFTGFISLLIGGWVFNRVDEFAVDVEWVMTSLFTVFMIISVAILVSPF